MSSLNKHVNIRITPEVNKKIESIKKEMEKSDGMVYSRSQIIFMLIVRGIQKYVEMQIP
jgi:hypothetical protein